jgi:glutamine phosphoribosylpyrophosphate amidotransferase
MCAVIGAILLEPTKQDFAMLKRVFLESKIRGMHATGITFIGKDGTLETYKEAVSADRFSWIDRLADCVADDGNLYLIGHCRYSTSDLEFNQPMHREDKSIVHNGVITQELPENWKELYGYDCITKNDSELVLHSEDPLQEFNHMSMGVVELYANKTMRFYRNGKRPIYLSSIPNGCIITSTMDIASRAQVGGIPVEVLMNHYITMDEHLAMHIERVDVADAVDYQHAIR